MLLYVSLLTVLTCSLCVSHLVSAPCLSPGPHPFSPGPRVSHLVPAPLSPVVPLSLTWSPHLSPGPRISHPVPASFRKRRGWRWRSAPSWAPSPCSPASSCSRCSGRVDSRVTWGNDQVSSSRGHSRVKQEGSLCRAAKLRQMMCCQRRVQAQLGSFYAPELLILNHCTGHHMCTHTSHTHTHAHTSHTHTHTHTHTKRNSII